VNLFNLLNTKPESVMKYLQIYVVSQYRNKNEKFYKHLFDVYEHFARVCCKFRNDQ